MLEWKREPEMIRTTLEACLQSIGALGSTRGQGGRRGAQSIAVEARAVLRFTTSIHQQIIYLFSQDPGCWLSAEAAAGIGFWVFTWAPFLSAALQSSVIGCGSS